MVDLEKIRAKSQIIEANLSRLEQLGAQPRDVFLADFRNVESAKRLFQTAIEAMIDAATHIVARRRLQTPTTNGEAFTRLAEVSLLLRERIPTYLAMVRFRNRLVHTYAEVDDGEVYRMLQMNLGDFRAFLGDLASLTAGERPSTEPPSA